jgi:septal ring factor EnvC (AmiA/AmiB activator)
MLFPCVTVPERHSKGITMIEERARHELYRGVEELLGTDRADTLMSLLPPVGWADVTTKTDLRSLDDRIDSRFSRVDARFTAIEARLVGIEARLDGIDARFSQIDARFSQIDARFSQIDDRFAKIDDRFAELERSMAQQTRTLVFSILGALFTMTSLCLGTIALAV